MDQTARIWDAASGKAIGEPLKGQKNAVTSAAFSPDGRRIITASFGGTARLWDVTSGRQNDELSKAMRGGSAAFSPDGRRIVTASGDKTARVWKIFPDTQTFVSASEAAVPRCLARATQGLLSATRAAGMVHRDGKVALRNAGMEAVARRQARRQEHAAALAAEGRLGSSRSDAGPIASSGASRHPRVESREQVLFP